MHFCSLTRQPDQRPTPSQLLTHPWIVKVMQQEVNMAFWLRKVWGWKKEKRQDDSYVFQFFPPLFTLFFLSLLHLSFDLLLFLVSLLFRSSSTLTSRRMNRILSRFTCSPNAATFHDIDVDSLILYPAVQARVAAPKHLSRLPWRVFG